RQPTLNEGRHPALLEARYRQRSTPIRAARQLDVSQHPHVKPVSRCSTNDRETTTLLWLTQIVGDVGRGSRLRAYERRDAVSPSIDLRKWMAAQQSDNQNRCECIARSDGVHDYGRLPR